MSRGWHDLWRFVDLRGEHAPIEVEALSMTVAPDGTLLIAIGPTEAKRETDAVVNLFSVDIATAEAKFIASAEITIYGWGLGASERHFAWTTRTCRPLEQQGELMIYERTTGTLRAFKVERMGFGSHLQVTWRMETSGLGASSI